MAEQQKVKLDDPKHPYEITMTEKQWIHNHYPHSETASYEDDKKK